MINVKGKAIKVEDIEKLWPEIRREILDGTAIAQVHITGSDLVLAKKIFSAWVKAPGYGMGNLGNAYVKDVDSLMELAWVLLGNVRAAANRRQEEFLARLVIGNLHIYEKIILDPLIERITEISQGNESLHASPTAYGPMVRGIEWSGDKWSVASFKGEKHEVLYVKVGFIHSFALSYIKLKKLSIPGRNESDLMRKKGSKGSLIEFENPLVYKDRLRCVSIWAGTSGSTMDILYFAKEVAGIKDATQLTCLAWCAFAFFHIMPTGISPTHTFNEVMRGAKTVAPGIFYDPNDPQLPALDPATFVQRLIGQLMRPAPPLLQSKL